MVWEQRVDIIVMLTKCMEKGKVTKDECVLLSTHFIDSFLFLLMSANYLFYTF